MLSVRLRELGSTPKLFLRKLEINGMQTLLKKKSSSIENCEYFLCTGLFDDHNEDLTFYKNLFEEHVEIDSCENEQVGENSGEYSN